MPARVGAAAAVVFAGLALAGCEKKGGGPVPPVEPEYGVPVSDTAGADEGGMPSDEGGAPSDEGGAPSDDGGVAEPEYGVPETPVEAEYGVPESP